MTSFDSTMTKNVKLSKGRLYTRFHGKTLQINVLIAYNVDLCNTAQFADKWEIRVM